ncbi:hypothetical protein DE146DRAFT_440486 [Phaeosphaeria sp. MPI-PUGE-AT-0046c]|nr:hypothetical protein DE146DRAFT_440486 [Phaeosphaeria sp. MPI-PUGE-AT-0046c]
MRHRAYNVLLLFYFAALFHTATSIPQSLSRRQDLFAGLQLPQCALTCFVTGLLTDGCANETDFACHCGTGRIVEKAAVCVKQGCGAKDGSDAMRKVGAACNAAGRGGGGRIDESRTRVGSSSAVASVSTIISSPGLPTPESSPSQQPLPDPNNSSNSQSASIPTPSSSDTTAPPTSASPSMTPAQTATEMPLALRPPSAQLSDGAKAGIAVSVSIIALSIFFTLGWYIRRLKRDLAAAQALVPSISSPTTWNRGPETVFHSTNTSIFPSYSRGRHSSSPVSPLSSPPPLIISDNGYGVLKKKRGDVLSIVVEDDEDRSSLVPSRNGTGAREPVPGQREGLSEPLELDGAWTGLFEAPVVVTPRERSRERS